MATCRQSSRRYIGCLSLVVAFVSQSPTWKFYVDCSLILRLNLNGRFHVMRMTFGGRTDAHDIHHSGLTLEFLGGFLQQAGFREIRRVDEFKEFNDASSLRFIGVLISLNIEARK